MTIETRWEVLRLKTFTESPSDSCHPSVWFEYYLEF